MKKLITLTGIAVLAAAAMFVWSQTEGTPPPDAGTTVGQSQPGFALQDGSSKPARPMLRRAPLAVETFD